MKAAFHYKFRIALIHCQSEGIYHEEEFEDENPILARIKALEEYEKWKKDLYNVTLNKPNEYIKHNQIGKDLEDNGYIGGCIGVSLVVDEPFEIFTEGSNASYEKGDTMFIHGDPWTDEIDLNDSLYCEFYFYQHYGYEIGDYKRTIEFYDPEFGRVDTIDILDTPFDWTGYNKRDWWKGEAEQEQKRNEKRIIEVRGIPIDIDWILENGETDNIEFKPSLVYDFITKAYNRMRNIRSAQTICAFLNSNGGLLFIGIDDNKIIQGIEPDFSLSEEKDPKDFFRLEIDRMISHHLGESIRPLIEGKFIKIDGKTIYVFVVFPSQKKVFLKGRQEDEFWIRGFASNRKIEDENKIEDYLEQKKDANELENYFNNKKSEKEEI